MEHFGGSELLDGVGVEVEDLAEPDVVDVLVAVGDEAVELAADDLLLGDVDHSAEATADRIDHQFEVILVALLQLHLRRDVLLGLEVLRGLLDVALLGVFDDCADGEGLSGAPLADADFLHDLGGVLDDAFGVVLEVGGGDEVHAVEDGGVEAEEVLLVLLDGQVVEFVELVHPTDYLSPQTL